jgi:hypothetical protein
MNALDEVLGALEDVEIKRVADLLESNPELREINKHVVQKDVNGRAR